jgi:putative cell wall-binding protein
LTKTHNHPVRRTAAGVLASTLALSGVVAAVTPAHAAAGFALERVQGNDRYETSAAVARAFGPTTGVILASGEAGRTVDALSANFLAGVQQVPVLLTHGTARRRPSVRC